VIQNRINVSVRFSINNPFRSHSNKISSSVCTPRSRRTDNRNRRDHSLLRLLPLHTAPVLRDFIIQFKQLQTTAPVSVLPTGPLTVYTKRKRKSLSRHYGRPIAKKSGQPLRARLASGKLTSSAFRPQEMWMNRNWVFELGRDCNIATMWLSPRILR
jgi:hypothetical protein